MRSCRSCNSITDIICVESTLLLTVIDSKGLSAGVSIATYDIAGKSSSIITYTLTQCTETLSDGDSSCLPSAPSVNITLTANITKSSITTCDKLGLRVWGGGKKPYTITLAAKNSTLVTNITLGPTDDVATYINRADPNGDLLGTGNSDMHRGFLQVTNNLYQRLCLMIMESGDRALEYLTPSVLLTCLVGEQARRQAALRLRISIPNNQPSRFPKLPSQQLLCL